MKSIFTRREEPPAFRISWRGYDQAEVDEFLRQTAADRQRLQEDLAQLEAVMATTGDERREMERLAAVRREVASCLETSIGALRTATGLLASAAPPPFAQPAASLHTLTPRVQLEPPRELPAVISQFGNLASFRPKLPAWSIERRKPLLIGLGSVAALMFAGFIYQNQPSANEMPDAQPAAAARATAPPPAAAPLRAEPPVAAAPAPVEALPPPPPQREDGLVLTVTARRACWIGSTLDGGQRLERMLAANETIMLRATTEAVLRIGDASAISMLINNQPTKALGAAGQVVTHRITRTNYRNLLEN
jgi:DivIVA domain-containing protein